MRSILTTFAERDLICFLGASPDRAAVSRSLGLIDDQGRRAGGDAPPSATRSPKTVITDWRVEL